MRKAADTKAMTDLFLSSQQQLSQALTQLNKIANASPLVAQARAVIVEQLSGHQILLNTGPRQQKLEIARWDGRDRVKQGDTYWIKLSSSKSTSSAQLQFFAAPPNTTQSAATELTTQQFKSLLQSSASQLTSANPKATAIITGKVVAIDNRQVEIALNIDGKTRQVTLPIPSSASARPPFQVGQNVQVLLSSKQEQWQIKLLNSTLAPDRTASAKAVNIDAAKASILLQSDGLKNLSPQSKIAVNLPLSSVLSMENVPLKALAQTLPQQGSAILTLTPGKAAQMSASPSVPVATATLSKGSMENLQSWIGKDLTGSNTSQFANASQTPKGPVQTAPTAASMVTNTPSSKDQIIQNTVPVTPSVALTDSVKPLEARPSEQSIQARLEQILRHIAQTASPTEVVDNKAMSQRIQGVQNQIQILLRQIAPQSANPSAALVAIEQALRDDMVLQEPKLSKPILTAVLNQLTQAVPQLATSDATSIRAMLSQTAMPLTPTQLIQPAPAEGLLNGLITLLQLSLAGRLSRIAPSTTERLANSIVSANLSSGSPNTPLQSTRTLQDFNQLEQKHQLLKQIGRLFAQHQSSKLGNVDQLLQGQDTFHYVLPTSGEGRKSDIELLIRRDTQQKEGRKQSVPAKHSWYLTMKLDVGELGQMLTKAKLRDNELDIDFYASAETLKNQVLNYLPLLNKRLASLGITVNKTQCQLGKIPDTLQNRPYHIFQTQA